MSSQDSMFNFSPITTNGINVELTYNTTSRSVVQFSSIATSTLPSFINRLKPLAQHIIEMLKAQQLIPASLNVRSSLYFGNTSSNVNNTVKLNNFYIDDVISELIFSSHKIDGGYFVLEITNPMEYQQDNLFYGGYPQNYDDEDSDYLSEESDLI